MAEEYDSDYLRREWKACRDLLPTACDEDLWTLPEVNISLALGDWRIDIAGTVYQSWNEVKKTELDKLQQARMLTFLRRILEMLNVGDLSFWSEQT